MSEEIKSPLKAIKQWCYECSGENYYEVKRCSSTDCVLFPFRFGKNPFRHVEFTDEQKQAAAERMIEARRKKAEKNE